MRINKRTLRKQKELLRELERKSKEAREAAQEIAYQFIMNQNRINIIEEQKVGSGEDQDLSDYDCSVDSEDSGESDNTKNIDQDILPSWATINDQKYL